MGMDAPRGMIVGMAFAAVGAALVITSALIDHAALGRFGFVPLLCGLAGAISARGHDDNNRMMALQTQLARLTAQERQRYTELGWRAAEIARCDAARRAEPTGDLVMFPEQPNQAARRSGSAQAGV